jgi:hypothetical protein
LFFTPFVFGAVEVIARFTEYFWLLHITMLIKLIMLRVALIFIKKRLEWQSTLEFLQLMDESLPYGKSYFRTASICNILVMAFYYGVWADEFVAGWLNVALITIFVLGTLAYILFSACVIMISITDAKVSHKCKMVVVMYVRGGSVERGVSHLT